MTYPLLVSAATIVKRLWFAQPETERAILAAFALGYGCSMRPGEYLQMPKRTRRLPCSASVVHIWWGQKWFAIHDKAAFPPGPADRVTVSLVSTKNDPYGKGPPRGVARAPNDVPFCCVSAIENFARHATISPADPAISRGGAALHWNYVRVVTRLVAVENGLDPKRLVPHCIRHGAPTQMGAAGMVDRDIRQQGGWFSDRGANHYTFPTVAASDRAAGHLHNGALVPTGHLAFALGALTGNRLLAQGSGSSIGAGAQPSHPANGQTTEDRFSLCG